MADLPVRVPISVKGIVSEAGKIWLRRNERAEWELPGGKLDNGEQPPETVVREMREELGFQVAVVQLVQAHLYNIAGSQDEGEGVLILSYLCDIEKRVGEFELAGEAGPAEFRAFSDGEISELRMPEFYKSAIATASRILRGPATTSL
jgi:8-oxo-dGTP pyrophosphatase MutT (NUDIX family)